MKVQITLVGLIVTGAFLASACSETSSYTYVAPATIEELSEDLWQIELTELGAERIGIETIEVNGAEGLSIPYSAVMYHFDGSTWTYTNPEPLVFVREAIDIDVIDGDVAFLHSGPTVGTAVVVIGAAELYGVEFGIGK